MFRQKKKKPQSIADMVSVVLDEASAATTHSCKLMHFVFFLSFMLIKNVVHLQQFYGGELGDAKSLRGVTQRKLIK